MTEAIRIEVKGAGRDTALRAHAVKRVREAIRLLKVAPVTAEVTFVDDNGPKGGLATRCAMTVRVPYRPAIRVEQSAETGRLAFDGGFTALERLLERYRERDRDSRRYPKKYYAARRLAGGERPGDEGEPGS